MDVRMLVKRIVVGWLILLALIALLGRVSVAETNSGQTAADFLLIGAGARAAGMGGAYSAVSDNALAAYWNPAGLANLEHNEILLSHYAWYQDMSLEYAVFARRLDNSMGLAASITYFNYGTIEGYDIDGNATGELSAYDLAAAVSFAMAAGDRLSLGLTGRFITQKLDDVGASSFAFDVGARYRFGRFSAAGVLSNLGPNMNFEGVSERLPTAGRIAVAAQVIEDRLLTSIELEKRFSGNTVVRNGMEIVFNEQYFVRTGYNFYPSAENRSLGSGFTVGLGLELSRVDFDYAYTFEEKYAAEDLHRFSVSFRFGP
ncbi:MAG: PorV/PorQ family protein [Candidatus Zixiibacteriota bacterium]|nr:MAG: PorV/PorQ family protein [candidate division Zixibacteria bacterium]